jgi:phosphoesterase RecJ-like protein
METQKIIDVIKGNKTFLVTTHVNPDPDALCSQLAVAMYLRSIGKNVYIVNSDPLLKRFDFLPGARGIKAYLEGMCVPCDVAVVVDCGELDRIGRVQNLLGRGEWIINIDHHMTNDRFGDLNLVDERASSTAEVLYEFLCKAKCALTKNVALNLYLGIMTDTGSFRFENTTPRVHEIASRLLKFKFSVSDLYRRIYECVPRDDFKEFAKLVTRFDAFFNGQVICLDLPKRVVSRFSDDFDLRDAIFKSLRSMRGVELFAIFTEAASKKTRVNFRSVRRVDVARLAGHFKGGGHKRASGCMIEGGIKHARQRVLEEIKKDKPFMGIPP